jgi:hypothetical protein
MRICAIICETGPKGKWKIIKERFFYGIEELLLNDRSLTTKRGDPMGRPFLNGGWGRPGKGALAKSP